MVACLIVQSALVRAKLVGKEAFATLRYSLSYFSVLLPNEAQHGELYLFLTQQAYHRSGTMEEALQRSAEYTLPHSGSTRDTDSTVTTALGARCSKKSETMVS